MALPTAAIALPQAVSGPKHLIVEANGLSGVPDDWKVLNECLAMELARGHYLVHASACNQRYATYQGIDACGERLAQEVLRLVQQHPSLEHISLVGHSMGGLIVRYAAGRLFDAERGTIAGLQPAHFISMASPNVGCDADGEPQVPLIGWMGKGTVKRLVGAMAPQLTSLVLKRTGRQFFLLDADFTAPPASCTSLRPPTMPSAPLVLQLAFDVPQGPKFWGALAAFRSRTCFANADGDHLVGWANSSLRFQSELPTLAAHEARSLSKGVALADPVAAAFHTGDSLPATVASALLYTVALQDRQRRTSAMIRSLQSLPWARIDCSWRGARVGVLAHNHIQVTRGWLNAEGRGVCKYFCKRFRELEVEASARDSSYAAAPVGTASWP